MTEGLVLASASTIRAQLLAAAGVYFRIEPAELDEGLLKQACRAEGRDAADCALALCRDQGAPGCGTLWSSPRHWRRSTSGLRRDLVRQARGSRTGPHPTSGARANPRACHGSLRRSGRIAIMACREPAASDYATFQRWPPR